MITPEYLEMVAPYNFWKREIDTGVWRSNYVDKILRIFTVPGIMASVTGVRRAGKTYICRQVLRRQIEHGMKKEQTLYVNFEDPALHPHLSVTFLQDLYETYRHYLNPKDETIIVLDEVQNVQGWEKWVRMMMETAENVKIMVTGSSSKIMSMELAPVLTGRHIDVRVYPLGFGEFLDFKQVSVSNLDIRTREMEDGIREYLEYGGFPTTVLTRDMEMRKEYLKELFESIITRDVAARYGVRRIHELKTTVGLLLQNVSSMVSVPKLTNTLKSTGIKISPTTVNQYLHHFRETLLFHYVPIFSYKVKDQMQYPKKAYCIDTGLVNAASFRQSENWGKLAENTVAIELFRRYGIDNVFYWRDRGGKEVDFVVVENRSVRELIQVTWEMGEKKTREREFRAILSAMEELSRDSALILTRNAEERIVIDGKDIVIFPLWKWLLQELPTMSQHRPPNNRDIT
ncbi:MAG: ATP-binding protein [Thermoplasmata archaeon]|nr:ATP-binding protein [Thermoplasmata archaeon]